MHSVSLKFLVGILSFSDYSPFGIQMVGRSGGEDYRYAFNGMEEDPEVSGDGNSYTTEFRGYDPRLGRWKSLDPLMAKFPHASPFEGFANNPIFYIDPKGDQADKLYNEYGQLLYDDGVGDKKWVVSGTDYQNKRQQASGANMPMMSEYLKSVGLQAYSTESEAALAWAPGAHKETREDPKHFERAAQIFQFAGKDGPSLFVLGNKVTGKKGSTPGVIQDVDANFSAAIVSGLNLLTVEKEYKGHRKGSFTNVFNNQTEYIDQDFVKRVKQWKVSGMIHTHPPGHDEFSASGRTDNNYNINVGGDIGMAKLGTNVYLVTTTTNYPRLKVLRYKDMKNVTHMYSSKYKKSAKELAKPVY
jgi:RHS repeat-associated protein